MSGAREREGLVARVRQMRRASAAAEKDAAAATSAATEKGAATDIDAEKGAATDIDAAASETNPDPSQLQALEARVAHLEELLEGLQDSVYREAHRQTRRLADLEARIEPAILAAELSRDARERGL